MSESKRGVPSIMGIQRCKRKFKNRVLLTAYEQYKFVEWFRKSIQKIVLDLPRAMCTMQGVQEEVFAFMSNYLPYVPPKIELNIQLEPEIHMVHIEGVLTV